MLRRAARQTTVPQAVLLGLAAIVIVAAGTWVVYPGTVAVDPLPAPQAEELQRQVDQVLLVRGGERAGYAIDQFVGPTHRCGPGELSFTDDHLLQRAIGTEPRRFAFLDARLAQQHEQCQMLRLDHAGVAGLIVAGAVVVALIGCAALRGRGPRLRPPARERAPQPVTSGCSYCGGPLGSPGFSLPGSATKLCDVCLARAQRLPLAFMWWLSALLLMTAAVLGTTGYALLATLVGGAGALIPILGVHVALHEAGHAAVGLVIGAREVRMRVGSGPLVGHAGVGRLRFEARMAPASGLTYAVPPTLAHYRAHFWAVCAAGPLVTAALVAAAWWAIPSELPWAGIRWIAVGVGGFLLVTNLIPVTRTTEVGPRATDGAQLLKVPFLDPSAVAERMAADILLRRYQAAGMRPTVADLTDGDRATIEQGAGTPWVAMLWATLESSGRDWEWLAKACRASLAAGLPAAAPAGLQATLQNNLAIALVRLDRVEPDGEADLASAAAFASDPTKPSFRGTRAEVLAATGRIDEARALAVSGVWEVWTDEGEPRWEGDPPEYARERHLVLADVEIWAGDVDAARRALEAGEERGADAEMVARIRGRLEQAMAASVLE